MKKFFFFALLLSSVAVYAEEGMWLPHLLGQQQYADMKAKGLKLSPEQLYSINKSSIKDAIVLVSTGCSGEIVSANGMIFTNHHCAYNALANVSASKAEQGYYANAASEEIPLPGVWVLFLVQVKDVTKQVEDSIALYADWNEWQTKKAAVFQQIQKQADAGTNYTSYVYSMFNENQYLLYTYEQYNDIRLVGLPPASMGAFGGETDNWEFPRQSADFAVLRMYTDPAGKPATYNAANVPYKSKYVLPISLKGYKENDFTMSMGYPGTTQRYQTSYGIRMAVDFVDPTIVHLRDIRLNALKTVMQKDSVTDVQLSPEFNAIANYWKFYNGEAKLAKQLNVYEERKKQEQPVANFIANKPEFTDLFRKYEQAYSSWIPFARHFVFYQEGILGINSLEFANQLEDLERMLINNKSKEINPEITLLDSLRKNMLAKTNLTAEQQMLAKIMEAFHKEIAGEQQPVLFYNLMKQGYGSLSDPETYTLWAKNAVENSFVLNNAKWDAFKKRPDAGSLQSDPLYFTVFSFRENWKKYRTQRTAFTQTIAALDHLYMKALLALNNKKPIYPDANASMRISYGNIKSYKVNDTTTIRYFNTATQMLAKYQPGDDEFDLPAHAVELIQQKNFGRYADPAQKDMLVSFVSTDDQTGGSSGSPLLNGSGQLIGISYDANNNAMINRFMYNKNGGRAINLDIRYLLWCVDKLAGCNYIMKELKIVP